MYPEYQTVSQRVLFRTRAASRSRHFSSNSVSSKPLARRTLRVRKGGGNRPAVAIFFGSQGGPCDPFTNDNAGGTPASKLFSEYRAGLRPCGSSIGCAFPPAAR